MPGLSAAGEFEHPNSQIGNAGWSGGLELWIEVARIPAGGETVIPLRLRFTSDEPRPGSVFGAHWWCPILECDGRMVSGYFTSTTFGGDKRYLLPCGAEEFWARDYSAIAREVDGVMEIKEGKWFYRYKEGNIESVRLPDGTVWDWQYAGGVPSGIRVRDTGKPLLTLERSKGALKMSGPFGVFVFREEPGSQVGVMNWALEFPDGRIMRIAMVPETAEITKLTISSAGDSEQVYRWKTSTGAILSDNDFKYEVRRTDAGEDILHRVDKNGRTEWYAADPTTGLATYKRQDGSRVQSWYHVAYGPTHMRAFRMDTFTKDMELVSSRLLTYDGSGKVEKDWVEPGKIGLPKGSGVRFIGTQEAEELHRRGDTLFIDARKKDIFEAGHIPGAVHIGRLSFEADYPALESRLKAASALVVYCTSRQCEDSSLVATRLSQLGYESVLIFEGGWAEWWKAHR